MNYGWAGGRGRGRRRMPGGRPRDPEGPRRRMRWLGTVEEKGEEVEEGEPSQWPEDYDPDYYPYADDAYPLSGEGGGLGDEGPHE